MAYYSPRQGWSESWKVIATFSDGASAHVLMELLRIEGVPTELVGNTSLVGEGRLCEVRVPSELAHRARWVIAQSHFTDAELTFLATGELDGDENGD